MRLSAAVARSTPIVARDCTLLGVIRSLILHVSQFIVLITQTNKHARAGPVNINT